MKCFHCRRTMMATEEKVPVRTQLQSGTYRQTDTCCAKCADAGCVLDYGMNKPMIPGKKVG